MSTATISSDLAARWDTGWYLGVAIDGYSFEHTREIQQQNIAFFPLCPMLLRYLSPFFAHQHLWVGVGVSLIAFLWALVYLFRLAREQLEPEAATAAVAFLATYPFALFYSARYTESIFLLTMVAACYHFQRDELWKAGAWGLAAGLSRRNGCLLSVVLALMALRGARSKPWPALADRIAAAAAPGIGMLVYSTYVYFLTGNPLQWTVQNAAWGRVYRGIDSLVSDRNLYIQNNGFYDYASNLGLDMIQAVAVLFALGAVWPVYRRFGVPYAVLILLTSCCRCRSVASSRWAASSPCCSRYSCGRCRRPRPPPYRLARWLRDDAGAVRDRVLHVEAALLKGAECEARSAKFVRGSKCEVRSAECVRRAKCAVRATFGARTSNSRTPHFALPARGATRVRRALRGERLDQPHRQADHRERRNRHRGENQPHARAQRRPRAAIRLGSVPPGSGSRSRP